VPKYFILYSLLLLLSIPVLSQTGSLQYDKAPIELKRFDNDKLNSYKKDKDFQYKETKQEKGILAKIMEWLSDLLYRFLSWLFGEQRATGILSVIISSLPYIVALVILLLILKVFLNIRADNIISGSARKSKILVSEEEEIIKTKDIKELIAKALKNNDYRLAIRYQYLYILQLLEKKGIISWEQQKTNHEYEREITDASLQNHFRNITYLYDFVWYGNFDIDKNDFSKASKIFTSIENKIK